MPVAFAFEREAGQRDGSLEARRVERAVQCALRRDSAFCVLIICGGDRREVGRGQRVCQRRRVRAGVRLSSCGKRERFRRNFQRRQPGDGAIPFRIEAERGVADCFRFDTVEPKTRGAAGQRGGDTFALNADAPGQFSGGDIDAFRGQGGEGEPAFRREVLGRSRDRTVKTNAPETDAFDEVGQAAPRLQRDGEVHRQVGAADRAVGGERQVFRRQTRGVDPDEAAIILDDVDVERGARRKRCAQFRAEQRTGGDFEIRPGGDLFKRVQRRAAFRREHAVDGGGEGQLPVGQGACRVQLNEGSRFIGQSRQSGDEAASRLACVQLQVQPTVREIAEIGQRDPPFRHISAPQGQRQRLFIALVPRSACGVEGDARIRRNHAGGDGDPLQRQFVDPHRDWRAGPVEQPARPFGEGAVLFHLDGDCGGRRRARHLHAGSREAGDFKLSPQNARGVPAQRKAFDLHPDAVAVGDGQADDIGRAVFAVFDALGFQLQLSGNGNLLKREVHEAVLQPKERQVRRRREGEEKRAYED